MAIYRRKINLFDILIYTFLILFSITIIYPFWNTIIMSFSDPNETTSLGIHLWINEWRLDSYRYIFNDDRLAYAYMNTIIRTVVGTAILMVFNMTGAFALSKKKLPGRNIITFYFILTMFFSGGLMPTYLLVRGLGLVDKIWALILPLSVNVYYMIITRNFLMSIDNALEESAFIDGANYFTIFTRIIMPVSKPIIATIVMWTAVLHWNQWFDALLYIRDDKKIVLQLLLRRLLQLTGTDREDMADFGMSSDIKIVASTVRSAIIIVTIGPIIAMYPFLQKYFIKGVMVGSLKG